MIPDPFFRSCWCGNAELVEFSKEYRLCPACQTLVMAAPPAQVDPHVSNDEQDFYGRKYWLEHQHEHYGYTNIDARSVSDLPERCLHWLRALLKYKLPQGNTKVLELGSAHGGFVALLQRAGFEATGLELSPWVVEYAQKTFGARTLLGPIEDQAIEPASLDAIALMDVLEHLPDPAGTMGKCLELLKPDGILLIQTPQYIEGRTYQQMVEDQDRFLEQFKVGEHLNLFSASSVTELFRRLGAEHIVFEKAIFDHYDMFLAVSRQAMPTHSAEEIRVALQRTADGRFIEAMLTLDAQNKSLATQFHQAEIDRQERLKGIQQLEAWLKESEADRAKRLELIEEQGKQIQQQAGQIAELNQWSAERAAEHEALLAEADAVRRSANDFSLQLADMQKQRDAVREQLEQGEAARAEEARTAAVRQQQIEILQAEQERLRGQSARLEAQEQALTVSLKRAQNRLDRARWVVEDQKRQLGAVRSRMAEAQRAIGALRHSPVYRVMKKVGSWGWLEPVLERAFPEGRSRNGGREPTSGKTRPRVVMDLTPVLPGGENGGAKLVVIGLIKQLKTLAADWDFILLTSGKSHDELAYLDGPNVRRLCVIFQNELKQGQAPPLQSLKMRIGQKLARILSPAAFDRLRRWDARVSATVTGTTLLRELEADLYFCAFGAPNYYDPAVPVVSVVYDLQYAYYPQFFPPRELYYRDKHFRDAALVASRLICISDYVRGTVIEKGNLPTERVVTSYIRLWKRVDKPMPERAEAVWQRFGLSKDEYLFFPANFWPHKNHTMLLTAFGMYLKRHPESELKLVFTGAPDDRMKLLRDEAVGRMGLQGRVVFAGFLPDEEFGALMEGCRALVFPSLYEGFGMPVLEAMQFGKPVLCSNVTSLPEVAGDAAILFDPRKPEEIVAAMEKIAGDDDLARRMVQRGLERVREFGSEEQMAREYLAAFRAVLGTRGPFFNRVDGLYNDGWAGERLRITYEAGPEGRELDLRVAIPQLPHGKTKLTVCHDGGGETESYELEGDAVTVIRRPLSAGGGFIEIQVGPLFRPKDVFAGNGDERELGCMVRECQIVYPEESFPDLVEAQGVNLLEQGG